MKQTKKEDVKLLLRVAWYGLLVLPINIFMFIIFLPITILHWSYFEVPREYRKKWFDEK